MGNLHAAGWLRRGLWLACLLPCLAAGATETGFLRSFENSEPAPPAPLAGASFSVDVAGGPGQAAALTAKPGVGFSGQRSLHYRGSAGGQQQAELYAVDLPVRPDTQLSYLIFPLSNAGDLRNPSTYVAVDLLFDDGSRLSTRGAREQHRIGAAARAQGEGRTLYPDQWNYLSIDVGAVAAGRTIKRIVLMHDGPAASFEGYLDDLRLGAAPADTRRRPSDFVDTRRGTNSNARFSRGNAFPAVAVPHGFNFWTPVTDAGSDWMYQYQQRNDVDNRPRLEAFALSHEPSPWMGDRQTFQLMPAAVARGAPSVNRAARALSFSHVDEDAHAHTYRVAFDNGIVTELAPTDHAAMFRFTFAGDRAQLVFDNRDDRGGIALDPSGQSFSGWSDVKSRLSAGATRLFFYGTLDQPVRESGRLRGEGRDHVAAWFGFDTTRQKVVHLRIATSLISLEQARHNLALEIAPGASFDDVRDRAQRQWDAQLGIVKVRGASRDELTTLYSNLYRLFLYPNAAYENTGTAAQPHWRYASPFSAPVGPDTPTQTGARVVDGKPYVNNGFWDTYRTAWPAYVLFTPTQAGEMIDGFVQQYRDGGWIARWSSPGYADLMVGTSADVAFADAWLKGVRNFDVRAFYQSALKDATVASPLAGTGRKGLQRAIFKGYTSTGVEEGLSWSMDGYINDFAIGNLAAALAQPPATDDPYAAHYADDAAYFRQRALGYANLFDPAVGFFVGRDGAGDWHHDAGDFDPLRWGGDYTETDAWNMAFHAPQDGAGLAALYGGRAALAAKLDALFATPGEFHVGSYGEPIHEMLEARDVRMGQYGHSNQPSHHIVYMYDYAGQPWKTQDKVRDVLSRLYVGSEIGQGYPGDEDNGEMSAWYLFSAAGFYPLRMGTPEYVIGAPYFPHMDIALENGKHLVIDAPGVSDTNRYVQGLRVNGQPWNRLTLPHALLAQGATLAFTMGPHPSRWASDEDALPPSITGEGLPQPLHDLVEQRLGRARGIPAIPGLPLLFDNDSATEVAWPAATATIDWYFGLPRRVSMLTLTAGSTATAPSGWQLQGSADGQYWSTLDTRRDERFAWPRQTRAFVVREPGAYAYYRLQVDAATTDARRALAEIELLGATSGP
ncbi:MULTISPECIES: GH92 family glycosyl hydrolase [Rhodanobacter]|uniref:GH92 family glycosyl hydrolase n=1 Tax=Rhodanobacter TaxID=75309 RepID=UPI0004241101|nr:MULTISPECIES: GH92 family glycosyl hydrolase [Rhodanobacter]KZC19129.1 alpha-1 2-mannosidase [Rhodanobacter denitrificans]UJJ51148.1 GH92 family glycosyl hydrolase [Rhodanobacter denitrificans]UJM93895.1 GH92 family glycosyl hydrolase [Rhodanobacter denitrificans]UJM97425.1 GH92 family glycosyl hydrolase [Rhodanobacter denitrificans]UJN23159.1 GH92 family glycosyl hydrolase [Rhodanobacter denitrificans]